MGKVGRWAAVGVLALGLAGGAASGLAEDLRPVPPMAPPEPLALSEAEPAPPKPAAAVALTWTSPAEVRVNRPAPYTLTVTNTGDKPAYQVVVQVRVPAGVTASDAQPAAKAVGGVLLWELGTLAAGESKPLAMNFASPTKGALTADAWVTCTGTAATTAQVREPKLEAFIEAPETVEVGEAFRVVYRANNAGDCPLDEVSLSCQPLTNLMSWSLSAKGCGRRPALLPGDDRMEDRRVWADRPGVLTFDLTATCQDGLAATATAKVKVLAPRLVVSVTGPDQLDLTGAAQYKVTVTNTGDLTAEDGHLDLDGGPELVLREPVRPVVGYEDVNAGAAARGRGLRPGETNQYSFWVTAAKPGGGVLKATVTERRGIKATAECRTVVKGVPGIRMEVVDAADPLKVGEETTYEVKVTNTGTAADRNLVLACDLPPGMTLVKAEGPAPYLERLGVDANRPGADKNVHAVTFEPVRELGPKTEAVFKVTVKAGKAGAANFTAVLVSDHLTNPVVKQESTTVYGE